MVRGLQSKFIQSCVSSAILVMSYYLRHINHRIATIHNMSNIIDRLFSLVLEFEYLLPREISLASSEARPGVVVECDWTPVKKECASKRVFRN